MSTSALVMMIGTMSVVISATAYFFVKVLRAPSRPEPDSYTDNDPKD